MLAAAEDELLLLWSNVEREKEARKEAQLGRQLTKHAQQAGHHQTGMSAAFYFEVMYGASCAQMANF